MNYKKIKPKTKQIHNEMDCHLTPHVAGMVTKEIKVAEATEMTVTGIEDALVTDGGAIAMTQIALHQVTIAM